MLAGQRRFLPQALLSSKGCSARTRARQSRCPTTIPCVAGYGWLWCRSPGGLLQVSVGRGSAALGSNHAAGSWVSTSGQHDKDNSPQRTQLPIASPSPPPAAAVSPFRHQRKLRVQYAVRGATPLHMPPARTTVEDLILEFHRMGCHTLRACNTGAQPRETQPTPSPPTQCACTQHVHGRSTGAPLPDPPARFPRD